jgi:serine/threonine-protein kinase
MDRAQSHSEETTGKYEVLSKLAEGGMAEVFLVKLKGPERFQKRLVMKRVRPELAFKDAYTDMFLDEARLVAQLQHDNIVQIFEVGFDGASYFLTMEYLIGTDCRELLHHTGSKAPLPIEQALYIVSCAAAGLHHAHEARDSDGAPLNIVHRDISPSNIFVTRDGAVKVLDFGVAKAEQQTTKTLSGALKGKISYMSPEQVLGGDVDRRTDVFALGVVLYEMVLGRRPFDDGGDTQMTILNRISMGQFEKPSVINPEIPPELDALICKALHQEPGARHASAEEFLNEVDQVADALQLRMSQRGLAKYLKRVSAVPDLLPEDSGSDESKPTVALRSSSSGQSRRSEVERLATGSNAEESFRNQETEVAPSLTGATVNAIGPSRARASSVSQISQTEAVGVGSWRQRAPIVVGAAFVALGAVFFLARGDGAQEVKTADPPPVRAAVGGPEARAPEPAPLKNESVSIELKLAPLDARGEIDGLLVTDRPIKLPRSSVAHQCRRLSKR